MPQIIVQAHTPDGTLGAVTLAERAVPTEQQNDHYIVQLIERVGWAIIDAEQLESQTNNPDQPTRTNTGLRNPHVPGRSASRHTGANLRGGSPKRRYRDELRSS
jgi:hypothetical protein